MTLKNINSVLLLGTDNMVALPVIRALGALIPNAAIHTLSYDHNKINNPEYSKYVHRRHYLELEKNDELVKKLINKIEETGAQILFPIDERDVRILSLSRHKLKNHVYLPPLPEASTLDKLVYKNRLADFLQNNDFPYAATYRLDRLNTAAIDDEFYPYLLKPIRGSSGQNIKRVDNKNELAESLLKLDSRNYILQELIPGQNFSCSLLAKNGNIQAETIQQGLASRDFNFSTAIRFVENEAVSEVTRQIIKTTNYSGLANLDFRLDERDHQPKLIDFNARFWSNISGAKIAGVDFVFLACLAAMNIPFKKPVSNGNTYLMGRNILNYYCEKILRPVSNGDTNSTYTDLWERINDPLPEVVRLIRSKSPSARSAKPEVPRDILTYQGI
ncbi:MAG TPA: ATP-grasp domain-containing protein [Balneolaceae bacterium]